MAQINKNTGHHDEVVHAPGSKHKHRILIVDDEKAIRDVFLRVVSYGLPDCRVDVAVNGAEAVEAFRQGHHDLILMDVKMPVMNGEDAYTEIERICCAENKALPPVIFCTGYDPSDRIQHIVNKNPIHCLLRKPVPNQLLMEALKIRLSR